MRAILNIIETINSTAAEQYVLAAEKAIEQECGSHIDIMIFPTPHERDHGTGVEIHQIVAEPMKGGWGTKAMTILCRLADEMGITLRLEIDNDEDDEWSDEDDYEEDEEEDNNSSIPSNDQLLAWYSQFGFVEKYGLTSRIQMWRKSAKS